MKVWVSCKKMRFWQAKCLKRYIMICQFLSSGRRHKINIPWPWPWPWDKHFASTARQKHRTSAIWQVESCHSLGDFYYLVLLVLLVFASYCCPWHRSPCGWCHRCWRWVLRSQHDTCQYSWSEYMKSFCWQLVHNRTAQNRGHGGSHQRNTLCSKNLHTLNACHYACIYRHIASLLPTWHAARESIVAEFQIVCQFLSQHRAAHSLRGDAGVSADVADCGHSHDTNSMCYTHHMYCMVCMCVRVSHDVCVNMCT
jgi:hypothetical protein